MDITNESDISLSQALAALEDVQNQECLRPHTKASIRDRLLQAYNDGLPKINLKPQPAESPDVNLNDLGFYTSLDKQIGSFREFDLRLFQERVVQAFQEYSPEKKPNWLKRRLTWFEKYIIAKAGTILNYPMD